MQGHSSLPPPDQGNKIAGRGSPTGWRRRPHARLAKRDRRILREMELVALVFASVIGRKRKSVFW